MTRSYYLSVPETRTQTRKGIEMSESSTRHWRNARGITNRLFVASDKNGRTLGTTFAYTIREAKEDFRRRGIKASKVYVS